MAMVLKKREIVFKASGEPVYRYRFQLDHEEAEVREVDIDELCDATFQLEVSI